MQLAALLLATFLCQPAAPHPRGAAVDQPSPARCSHRRRERSPPAPSAQPPAPLAQQAQGRDPARPARPAPDSPMLNYIFDSHAPSHKHLHDRFNSPTFEDTAGGEDGAAGGGAGAVARVEADTGQTVHLDCKVSGLQEKLVSWLRVYEEEQLELLTVGLKTHTADARWRVEASGGDNWRLALRGARAHDSGLYCCQVSTHPPMLRRTALTVHPPELAVARDAFLESGETLSLWCRVRHVAWRGGGGGGGAGEEGEADAAGETGAAPALHWYRGAERLDLAPLAGGVLVTTANTPGDITSELRVSRLAPRHAGNYTCRLEAAALALALQASTAVHVLQGSSLAELQSGGPSARGSQRVALLLLLLLLLHCVRAAASTSRGGGAGRSR